MLGDDFFFDYQSGECFSKKEDCLSNEGTQWLQLDDGTNYCQWGDEEESTWSDEDLRSEVNKQHLTKLNYLPCIQEPGMVWMEASCQEYS